ncbi:helix-turn-helix domain-containing protein [Conexibacter sp. JD483]|uniref:TetR/AcrR family transcriptional regulator n=1 Tax=unclassified Conexibacter TaxID=2627773 RepID=UPI00272532A2|nr:MULTISPECIES: TetR/AcrR family transcriptional regulator [unclassified Conexibacter]MDO8189554.1 helix-turn-helix domain-containing protein [Conexibacter sp. CPCC 205706]MDO8202114.1 helix-turn-helix domain-containing protein [Conexibacter sp. CPCC 205762]MDR9372934.1 helix-turn-helix domain-containing protein [Conexibacter sp. JD483]
MTTTQPAGSMRERKKAAAKAAVVSAAISLFSERGYDAVSVAEICEAADIARRSFFRYFGTKEDLILEPYRAMDARVHRSIAAAPAELSDREVFERALRDLAVYMLGNWDDLIGTFQILERATTLRGTVNAQLADQERGLADALLQRRSDPSAPDWQTLLLVGRATAAYRVWLSEMRTTAVSDPLDLLETIFQAQT